MEDECFTTCGAHQVGPTPFLNYYAQGPPPLVFHLHNAFTMDHVQGSNWTVLWPRSSTCTTCSECSICLSFGSQKNMMYFNIVKLLFFTKNQQHETMANTNSHATTIRTTHTTNHEASFHQRDTQTIDAQHQLTLGSNMVKKVLCWSYNPNENQVGAKADTNMSVAPKNGIPKRHLGTWNQRLKPAKP